MGPLTGVKVLELEAIGPAPFAGMLLADMGADVLVIDRPGDAGLGLKCERSQDIMLRGKRSVMLDLKSPRGAQAASALIARADALIERSEEHTSELQSRSDLVCRLLLEKN